MAKIQTEIEIKCVQNDDEQVLIPSGAKQTIARQQEWNWYYKPAGLLGRLLGDTLSARLRTRDSNLGCIFILKSGADPVNGVERQEFEVVIKDRSAKLLEAVLLATGLFTSVAKWSRVRDQYDYGDCIITVDENSGYNQLLGTVYEVEGPSVERVEEVMAEMGVRALGSDELNAAYEKVIAEPAYYTEFCRKYKAL